MANPNDAVEISSDKFASSHEVASPAPSGAPSPSRNLTRLSLEDHALVCHAIGVISDLEAHHSSMHPDSGFHLPDNFPPGLYRDVRRAKIISQYQFVFVSCFYNISVVLQLLFGAALTALSSDSSRNHANALTIMAAANTVNAGLVALLHNSGMPHRFKNDMAEFDAVEEHLREIMDTGIIEGSWTKEMVVKDCWERWRKAKEAVGKNKPTAYKGTKNGGVDKGT